jgi:hypothetical protein
MVGWRCRSACLWITSRVVVAFALLWIGRRFARVMDARKSCAIEQCGCGAAPLVLFALLWLLDDSPQQSKRWAAPV